MCQTRLLSKRLLSMIPIIAQCENCILILSRLVDNCRVTVSTNCVILSISCVNHLFSSSDSSKCIILIHISVSRVFCVRFVAAKDHACSRKDLIELRIIAQLRMRHVPALSKRLLDQLMRLYYGKCC